MRKAYLDNYVLLAYILPQLAHLGPIVEPEVDVENRVDQSILTSECLLLQRLTAMLTLPEMKERSPR